MSCLQVEFIICVNNPQLYEKCIYFIKMLIVPPKVTVVVTPIKNAKDIFSAYNQAMSHSTARVKVYLHQDVFILNKNFISDILFLFNKYPNIGMIGVVGSKTIPDNGVWWNEPDSYGKVFEYRQGYTLLNLKEVIGPYVPVAAIDGLIMITQYDVSWREDIFTGWHFYDVSQTTEFIRHGYEVVIPQQETPWCLHFCGPTINLEGYEDAKSIFLEHYKRRE